MEDYLFFRVILRVIVMPFGSRGPEIFPKKRKYIARHRRRTRGEVNCFLEKIYESLRCCFVVECLEVILRVSEIPFCIGG